ncbi:MAG: transposase [Nanoarchaeota archaeon]|nr:transposase [Nanoarchaeota archaeon]MBU1103253.1 transposase [Nanoarchaeota archaeon]
MNLLKSLFDNRWVKKLIKFTQKEDKLLNAVNLNFIDRLVEQDKKTKRGRKREYKLSKIFKLVIDGFRNGRTAATEIARFAQDIFVKAKHELDGNISHDTISRFWIALQSIAKKIFQKIVRHSQKLGIFYPGLSQVLDGSDIATRFRKDSDAKWNYDSTRKRYYFGYGLFISVDPMSQLPIAGFITDSKKVNKKECHKMLEEVMIIPPSVITGDPEFDVTDLVEKAMKENIQFIAPYNARNAKPPLPIDYRAELYGFSRDWMREEIYLRTEVEHTFSTLKEHFHLLDFHVRGREKVEAHLLFVLCMRLLHGIATFKIGKSPRQITHL